MLPQIWQLAGKDPDGHYKFCKMQRSMKLRMEQIRALKNTMPDLLPEGSLRKRESIMMRHLLRWLDIIPSYQSFLLLQLWMEVVLDGCQYNFLRLEAW